MPSSRTDALVAPSLLQWLGIGLLVVSCAYWVISGQESAIFVTAGVLMVALGAIGGIRRAIWTEEES